MLRVGSVKLSWKYSFMAWKKHALSLQSPFWAPDAIA